MTRIWRRLLAVSLLFAVEPANVFGQCANGSWAPGFNDPTGPNPGFEAVNLSVIPGPTNSGKIIVFEKSDHPAGSPFPWSQKFAIGDPDVGLFTDFSILIPPPFNGDLFCSGHVWLPDGRLFVAGGTTQYHDNIPSTFHFLGSTFVGIWDPAGVGGINNGWILNLPPMQRRRWYPTVTMMGNNTIVVSGGTDDANSDYCTYFSDPSFDTYEVWNIPTNTWVGGGTVYNGPNAGCFSVFGEYARQHLLTSGHLFVDGMFRGANRVHPTNPSTWLTNPIDTGDFRGYGSSVLVPNIGRTSAGTDLVMILGGQNGVKFNPAMNTCMTINAYNGTAWASAASMNHARQMANAVLLPDGSILVIGGCSDDYFNTSAPNHVPVLIPELYTRPANTWVDQNPQQSTRMYHSTAALLPSGKVVSAGSDIRTSDYEIFTPGYIACGQTRPAYGSPLPQQLNWATQYTFPLQTLPPPMTIDRVVLMKPCSVTHNSDMDQRYVELQITAKSSTSVTIKTPNPPAALSTTQNSVVTPPGWYMMFLINSPYGTPSTATWVHF